MQFTIGLIFFMLLCSLPCLAQLPSGELAESEAVTFILGLSSQLANVAHFEQKQKCHCAALPSPGYDWANDQPQNLQIFEIALLCHQQSSRQGLSIFGVLLTL